MKAESSIGLVQVNYLLLQQLIQILALQHRLPQIICRKMGIKNLWKLSVNSLFLHEKSSDFRFVTCFMSIPKFGRPRL